MHGTYFGWYYSTIKQMKNVKTIMRNDFKMIVFKQLTISIKTHDNKINVSCSANQHNVTLLNMTINTVGILNLSTLFGALFEFLHLLRRLIFSLSRNTSSVLHSMLNAKRFEIVYVLHHLYIMYSSVKTLSDATELPAGSMGFVPTGHRPIKS